MSDPVFLLADDGSGLFKGLGGDVLRTRDEVAGALRGRSAGRWFASGPAALSLLGDARGRECSPHRLLTLSPPSAARREILHALFRVVVAPGDGIFLLPPEQLGEVLVAKTPADYFIGGAVDQEDGLVVLYRGNLDRLLIPLDWFRGGPRSPKADPKDFSVIDCGQTIRLGAFEAAGDAVLYEFDADARRRMRDRQVEKDDTFGGSLRRLRLLRGLSRGDFEGVNEKTIARIERGEVDTPQQDTLEAIARTLGVEQDEIKTFLPGRPKVRVDLARALALRRDGLSFATAKRMGSRLGLLHAALCRSTTPPEVPSSEP